MPAYSVKILSNLRAVLLGVMFIVFVGFVSVTAYVIYDDREREVQRAADTMQSLAMALGREAESTLTLAEMVLDGSIETLNLSEPKALSNTEQIHRAFIAQREQLLGDGSKPSFAHLFLLGADGFNIANSVSYPAKRINASDRSYFQFHLDHTGEELHISQPAYSKVTQERIIFLTKCIRSGEGEFLGVIGIHLKLRHFDHLYSALGLPPGGTVTVVRLDGTGVFRYPMTETFFETSVSKAAGFTEMLDRKMGSWQSIPSPYDGAIRTVGFYVSDKYPLLNIVSVTHDSVLAGWFEHSVRNVVVAILGVLLIIALTFFSHRQVGHLIYALQLSSHDGLTDLWNRRAFDERMDEEWRRAARRKHPVSLLFVDVDFFKLYNDEYGHQAGDRCLKLIAHAIEKTFSRGGEFVARYGGEEFVVLLPKMTGDEAEVSAQRLLTSVEMLRIPHEYSSVSKWITVSVGVATMHPVKEGSVEQLTDSADSALYQAKRAGRNRYVVA